MEKIKVVMEFLATHGFSLEQAFGLSEWAVTLQDAFVAVEMARGSGLIILGGDLFIKKRSGIEMAYSNWYVDPEKGETTEVYSRRSCDRAGEYLRSLPTPEGGEFLVTFVLREPISQYLT